MKPIILPIYYHTTETALDDELGLDNTTIADAELRPTVFYQITAVGIYIEKDTDKEYGRIYANGMEFTSPLTAEEIRVVIEIKEKGIDFTPPSLRKKIEDIESRYIKHKR